MSFDRKSSLGWLVAALHQQMAQDMDKGLAQHDLPLALWPTMMCLWEEDNRTQADIAKSAKVQSYTTTRALDKLETMGWVVRTEDANSRRSHRIQLTEKGHAAREEVLKVPVEVNQETTKALTKEETEQLIGLLQKLVLKT
ncbi:MAG: MarR family winged helix-turn-helix transcriptional regulator [Oceanobacter sp.]